MSLKIQTALLPQKHIDFSRSIIGLAGFVLSVVKERALAIDEIWAIASAEDGRWPTKPSPEQVTLAVLLLFSIGQVQEAPGGRIGIHK
jgi:hypothetical protein